jgi:hypothetical protein
MSPVVAAETLWRGRRNFTEREVAVKRIALGLTVVALTLTACQDVQQPAADFQVADGSVFGGKAGNPHFFFLPPIVPEPDYTGIFDGNLLPYLSLTISKGYLDDQFTGCGETQWVIAEGNGLYLDEQLEAYRYDWKADGLTRGQVHRLCVVLDLPGTGPGLEPITLGFRDVSPTLGGGSVAEDPIYLFNAGSNVPVKFRVEKGVLSSELCTAGTLGQDYDCTAQILNSNETAVCDNATCELTTGILGAPELFLIEKFALDNPLCFESDGTSSVAGFPLDIDIPQYAGCVRVTIFDPDQSFAGFLEDSYGTVGACFYPASGSPVKIAAGQDEAIQMHIQYPGQDTTVWALPWGSTGGIVEQCEIVETQSAPSSSLGSQVVAEARKLWRGTQRLLNPWFAPPVVYAFHTGFGGHTTFSRGEESLDGSSPSLMASMLADGGAMDEPPPATEQVFSLAWALPSQMARHALCVGTGCTTLATSPLTVKLDQTVTVAVQVTDNGAIADALAGGGRRLDDPRGVEGARVHFAVSTDPGAGTSVYTDELGVARFTWVANTTAPTTITASGFGIGTTGGPYDAFAGTTYDPTLATRLARGTLSFDVRVCPAGATVDGVVTNGEYGPNSTHFRAKVSGGETDAWLYWTWDCDNVYFALEVAGSAELANELRLVFDNEYGSGASVGDDQWNLKKDGKTGKFVFADRFLDAKCVGSKQSDCGTDDSAAGGTNDIIDNAVVNYDGTKGVTVFELARPLTTTDANLDFQVSLATGRTLGLYVVLQLGKGAQGNTEFPGFRNYMPIQIGPLQ